MKSTSSRAILFALCAAYSGCLPSNYTPPDTSADLSYPRRDAAAATCKPGDPLGTCYDGPAGTRGVGNCRAGQLLCVQDGGSQCFAQDTPQPEVCNSLDDNCDGRTDENLIDSCGHCDTYGMRDLATFGMGSRQGFTAGQGFTCSNACCDCLLAAPGATSTFSAVIDGCKDVGANCFGGHDGGRVWQGVSYKATLQPGSHLLIEVRAAATVAELANQTFMPVAAAAAPDYFADLPAGTGQARYLEARVTIVDGNVPTPSRLCALMFSISVLI